MNDWMQALAGQYRQTRRRYPDDELLIVFDIDGTILDMRHLVHRVLLDYDRRHGTRFFYGLQIEDIDVHENQAESLLHRLGIPQDSVHVIHEWYLRHAWSAEAILAAHEPFQGVLDIIRWFQIQPRTHVGLNTGRPETLRAETLASLNELGHEYRVQFESDLLHMNADPKQRTVVRAKAEGLGHFRDRGFRIFAVVDNEPVNIAAMSEADPDHDILFLHADTLFESKREPTPRTVSGSTYDITSLVSEQGLP
ncbi:MAG: HAD family hydrolase, partial [Planctomycetota bacterium]